MSRAPFLRWLLAGASVLAAMVGLWTFWIEPASLRVRVHRLELRAWPAACDGLRVAVLADLHVGSPYNGLDKLAEVVSATRTAEPDLILLAGDYVIHGVVGGTFVPPEEAATILGTLRAPMGVYAVLGNHDWWYDAARVARALEQVGIPVLEDAARHLEANGCGLWLAGVSDYWEGAHDVGAALRDVPAGAPTVLFTHNPDVFPVVPRRVLLTIAAHTHGGQVFLPGFGRPLVPSEFGERFAIGHVVENDRHLFVSSGVGTSILPIRFLVPPEISLLVLHAQSPPSPPGDPG